MCLKGTNSNTAYDVKMRIQKLFHHFGELGVSQKVGKKSLKWHENATHPIYLSN